MIGPLYPDDSENPRYLQLYFDGSEEHAFRCRAYHDLMPDIIHDSMTYLHEHNDLIRAFKYHLEDMQPSDKEIVIRADRVPAGEHSRFNEPKTDECAAIIVDGNCHSKDIVIQTEGGRLRRISEIHPDNDALQYPLIFPTAQQSYSIDLKKIDPRTGHETAKRISPAEYYCYKIMIRSDSMNHILRCFNLLNQLLVGMYAKIEAQRLKFLIK